MRKVAMKLQRAYLAAAILAVRTIHSSAAVLYVDGSSPNPVAPYSDWTTAATNIQDAIDAAMNGDQILVANGTYRTGGKVTSDGTTNCIVVTHSMTLQSANGPDVTLIDGGHTMRCAYLAIGVQLIGFTLTNGYADNGGGVWCASTNALLSNCSLINNSAKFGGGAYSGALTNCTLSGNSVGFTGTGGGAYGSTLNNCTLTANSSGNLGGGGGAAGCALKYCT